MQRWHSSRALLIAITLVLVGCPEDDTGQAPDDTGVAIPDTKEEPKDTQEPGACNPDNKGEPCDDGDPCTVDDQCGDLNQCVGGISKICVESDNNPCTEARCDAVKGSADKGYCIEDPITVAEAQNACYRYSCTDGVEKQLGPAETNDCESWEVEQTGCVNHYICDPDYTAVGGSHCRAVAKPNGTTCRAQSAQGLVSVKPSGSAATPDEPSVCSLYVCHAEPQAGADLSEAKCVLSSTLPEDTQKELIDGGGTLTHECSIENAPENVSTDCNAWQCGCKGGDCTMAECQVKALTSKTGKSCDNGDLCDGSVCMPAKGAGALMECKAPANSVESCDVFPNAECDVSQPCDPQKGCPNQMDKDASNAKCQVNNPCIDSFNTYCAPNDPNADPVTGCVVSYKTPGTACAQALKDGCVLKASCQPSGESMKCEVTQWVECNDGNPCTKDFCADGVCQATDLPGTCNDGDACTENDLCINGTCSGKATSCDDGLECTTDSCNKVSGCKNAPNNDACDDGNVCTSNACVPGQGCTALAVSGQCDDGDPCTDQDQCNKGACEGVLVLNEGPLCDGLDNDCDGAIDEDCTYQTPSYLFGDGFSANADNGEYFIQHTIGTPRFVGTSIGSGFIVKPGKPKGEK